MTTKLKLVKIGNSKGIRIPQVLIQRYHLGEEVELTETATGLLLEASNPAKLSLDESFEAMAKDSESKAEFKDWDATIADGLEDEDFEGWPR